MRTRRFPAYVLSIALTGLVAACGAQSVAPSDVVTPPLDAVRVDVAGDHVVRPDAIGCTSDARCDDGLFCNGAERCVGGACVAGAAPCDDAITCTQDVCNETTRVCSHTPNDAPCSDHMACNGDERCAPSAMGANPMTGCLPPGSGSLDCDDGNVCTIDTCSDMTGGCVHTPRDLDGDGFVDAMCGGPDCNDADPNVHPGATENCSNGIDDDCNGFVDGADPACMMVAGDTCATAIALPGPGTYSATTVGHGDHVALMCGGPTSTGPDAVFALTLPSPQFVTVSLAGTAGVQFAVAEAPSCAPLMVDSCEGGVGSDTGSGIGALLPAGTSYVIVQTAAPEDFTLTVSFGTPTPHTTYVVSMPTIPFVDVCAIPGHGTALSSQDDTTVALPTPADVAPATLPFSLRMYDAVAAPPLSVSSNGWLSLLPTTSNSLFPQLPSTMEPNLTIAGLWEDLVTSVTGVCYAAVGITPNQRFIVEWSDATLFSNRAAHITFEIAIDQALAIDNNTIEMVFQHVSDSAMPGTGVENASGTAAVTYPGPITDGLALRFTPVTM